MRKFYNCTDCGAGGSTPVPCVEAPTSCEGEKCAEIYPAQCVEYQDEEELVAIGAKKGDRLNLILKKINALGTTQAIAVEDTNSVDLSGTGLSVDKLKADLRVDPVAGNLIKVGVNGVSVTLDKAAVTGILNLIKSDSDLTALFCEIASGCNMCGGEPNTLTGTVS